MIHALYNKYFHEDQPLIRSGIRLQPPEDILLSDLLMCAKKMAGRRDDGDGTLFHGESCVGLAWIFSK